MMFITENLLLPLLNTKQLYW